jgi:hypothetical protein
MFRAFLCPSSGAYQLQQQPLVYRRNVVVAVLLVVVGPNGPTFADRGVSRGQRNGSLRPLNLCFLDMEPLLLFIQVAPQLTSRG